MNLEEQILWCIDIAEKSKYLIEHGIDDGTKRIGKESSEKYKQYAKWLEELKIVHDVIDDLEDYDEVLVGYLKKKMEGEI